MAEVHKAPSREEVRDILLDEWARTNGIHLTRFDAGQLWLLFFGLQVVGFLGEVAPLKRILGYFLAAAKFDLGSTAIGAIVGVSDRAIRNTQSLTPVDMLYNLQHPVSGHRQPKLEAHHAGPIAKFLVENRRAKVQEVLDFIGREFKISLDRKTLRTFIGNYGLGCLRGDIVEDAPLF